MINCRLLHSRKKVLSLLKPRYSNSVFWRYVLVSTTLALITCICVGAVLSSGYSRIINNRNEQILEDRASRAVENLDTQIESMHYVSLQLSIKLTYQPEYALNNTIEVARAFSQYRSLCPMATQFALMYPTEDRVLLFQQDGTTADLDVFLKRFQLADDVVTRDFLFRQEASGRVFLAPDGILVAFPVALKNGKPEATLCFCVSYTDLRDYVRMASTLEPGEYRLVYQSTELVSAVLPDRTISSGSPDSFCIYLAVPRISLASLVSTPRDILSLLGCALLLFIAVFILAWTCYRPIRSLSHKHASSTTNGIKNELILLDQIISQSKDHSQLLKQQYSEQATLLQDYVLLMLLNNSGTVTIAQDLQNAGISFPYNLFAVVTLTPCNDQIFTQDNMDTVKQYIRDSAEDIGVIQAVECNRAGHILAIVFNTQNTDMYDALVQRLHTYLNNQGRRFLVGEGPITDTLTGVSASYLAALSHLRTLAGAQSGIPAPAKDDSTEPNALINRIVRQIECGDCQQALVNLDTYMESIGQNQSELVRRYHVMNITFAIQQLCNKLNFQLTESQMSMLLSMRSLRTIHFALLQLIPALSIHAEKQNQAAILSTGRLVMDYLNAHFCDYDITLQQVAEATGIGINRAGTILREETGHSFKTVLTQLRITRAKELLRTGMSVSDVASQVGYGSASYFIKVFKSSEGITPDAYRKSRFRDDAESAQGTDQGTEEQ